MIYQCDDLFRKTPSFNEPFFSAKGILKNTLNKQKANPSPRPLMNLDTPRKTLKKLDLKQASSQNFALSSYGSELKKPRSESSYTLSQRTLKPKPEEQLPKLLSDTTIPDPTVKSVPTSCKSVSLHQPKYFIMPVK
jgi:hypothetical protein